MGLERLQDKIHFPLGDSPWQQVVETFPDIAYIMSPDGVIVEANPRMCNMLQLPREKLLGSNIADYLTVEQGETVKRTLKEICRQRLPERSTQSYKLTTNDIRIYEVIESPLIEGGQVQAISGIGREITQEAALEHKLWDLADNRRGAVDFTLRTSLGLVKGYVYTLRRYGDLNEEQRTRYIQIIEEEIDSLSRTVENILDMRRLENAEFEIERDIIDLGECMRLAIRQCESDASRRSVEISADIPDHLDPMYIPKDAVCRVLTNLIQNSVHHSLQGGHVQMAVRSTETYVEIRVKDEGVGIPEGDLPFIFDKYFRGAGSSATSANGSGMGLAISRLLSEALGGKISVHSQVGKGSEFLVVLPRRPLDTNHMGETQAWTSDLAIAEFTSRN